VWTEKRRVATRDGDIALVERGDPAAPTVLLLHGLGTSSYLWRQLVPLLSTSMHVVAPDLLGAGDSDDGGADRSIRGHVARVREVLADVGVDRVAAVGHGLGGVIAQSLAVEGLVDALALMSSDAFGVPPALPSTEDGEAWVRELFDLGMSRRERLSVADLEAFARPLRAKPAPVVVSDDAPSEADLATLEIPAIVLWGEDDRILDASMAERIGDALPRATIALLPGCGHFLLEDAAETVAPLLFQWLRSQYLQIEHRHEAGPVVVELGRRPAGEDR
jgi:pimeloyl-ACP methyl ester carboxylesterase